MRDGRQHQNVVDAAKLAGVKHVCICIFPYIYHCEASFFELSYQVWYTSLAFGGLESNSKVSVQQAHYMTEEMLRR